MKETKTYTRATLAGLLQCCNRTLHRATQEGDLLPECADPVTYAEKDVLEFLNDNRKGHAGLLTSIPVDFVNTKQLSKSLGVSADTVRRWTRDSEANGMPHYRLSQTWVLFCAADIAQWIGKNTSSEAKKKRERDSRMYGMKRKYLRLRDIRRTVKKGVK